jgi:glycosyltransferase involved in cell wall biosynthesis
VSLLSKLLPKTKRERGKFFLERAHWYNHFSKSSMKTWKSLDEIYRFNDKDRFVLPNADHLTTKSLIRYFKAKKNNQCPSVGLRFINVMENNAVPRLIKPDNLFRFLEKSKNKGIKINVAAETEGYRAFIGQFVTGTFICEYPQDQMVKPRSSSSFSKKNFTVGSLGSARPDKGFTKLKGLVTRILAAHGSNVKVVIQEGLTSWNTEYDLTLSELRSYPQVTFLPGYLTQKEMQNAVNVCDILLMPYDEPTYEFRGSAMLFEAADLQIPILVPSRTGLGEVVRKYGIGATYTSESDLNRALEVVLKLDSKILAARFQEYNSQRKKNFKKLLIG